MCLNCCLAWKALGIHAIVDDGRMLGRQRPGASGLVSTVVVSDRTVARNLAPAGRDGSTWTAAPEGGIARAHAASPSCRSGQPAGGVLSSLGFLLDPGSAARRSDPPATRSPTSVIDPGRKSMRAETPAFGTEFRPEGLMTEQAAVSPSTSQLGSGTVKPRIKTHARCGGMSRLNGFAGLPLTTACPRPATIRDERAPSPFVGTTDQLREPSTWRRTPDFVS